MTGKSDQFKTSLARTCGIPAATRLVILLCMVKSTLKQHMWDDNSPCNQQVIGMIGKNGAARPCKIKGRLNI
jgi:hypothetical protein